MICKVRTTVEKYNMPLKGSTVIVALSGGADSMALLDVLEKLKDEYALKIIACHVNHGIRGEQADSDEKFVKDYCNDNGIEIKILKADVPKLSEELGMGLEECGRKVRYDFFNEVCPDALIATAHTLSDRCETLIFNETRGTSVKGLCSIPAKRENIIRPLIDCTRSEIEQYCKENRIDFVTDKTNFDDTYSRNRIRLNVIPELKKINPSAENAFSRLIESANEDEEYFSSLVDKLIDEAETENGYNISAVLHQHIAVRRRFLAEIVRRKANVNAEKIHIMQIDEILNGGRTEIIGNTVIEVTDNILLVNPEKKQFGPWECDFSSLYADTPSGEIKGCIFNRNELSKTQIVHNNVLDFESIIGKLTVRNRRSGDKMMMVSSGCTKTLKKLFNEKHFVDRDNIFIIEDEVGIVLVEHLGCDDRCKITDKTTKVLVIGGQKND